MAEIKKIKNVNYDFKNLTPFKWFVLENFPFIEEDFDALTNWQLFCKLGKYMNDLINSQNSVGEQTELLTTNFNSLNNYVHNYFDNLNVQDEINTKLDEMVKTGELQKLLSQQYNELKQEINSEINEITTEQVIMIGDSYSLDRRPNVDITGWAIPLMNIMGLNSSNCFISQDNGGGFTKSGTYGNFLQALQRINPTNKNLVKKIIVCGGRNDAEASAELMDTQIKEFMNYTKNNFKNAKVYFGFIGNENDLSGNNQYRRYQMINTTLPAFMNCTKYGGIYLCGVENVMHDYSHYYDSTHPDQYLCEQLAYYIYQAIESGYANVIYPIKKIEFVSSEIAWQTGYNFTARIINNNLFINQYDNNNTVLSFVSGITNHRILNGNLFLGTIKPNYFCPAYPNYVIGTCFVDIQVDGDSNNDLKNQFAKIIINPLYQFSIELQDKSINKPSTLSVTFRNIQGFSPSINC